MGIIIIRIILQTSPRNVKAKEGQPADTVALAKAGDLVPGNRDLYFSHFVLLLNPTWESGAPTPGPSPNPGREESEALSPFPSPQLGRGGSLPPPELGEGRGGGHPPRHPIPGAVPASNRRAAPLAGRAGRPGRRHGSRSAPPAPRSPPRPQAPLQRRLGWNSGRHGGTTRLG
jgi:hypothetical protein